MHASDERKPDPAEPLQRKKPPRMDDEANGYSAPHRTFLPPYAASQYPMRKKTSCLPALRVQADPESVCRNFECLYLQTHTHASFQLLFQPRSHAAPSIISP